MYNRVHGFRKISTHCTSICTHKKRSCVAEQPLPGQAAVPKERTGPVLRLADVLVGARSVEHVENYPTDHNERIVTPTESRILGSLLAFVRLDG